MAARMEKTKHPGIYRRGGRYVVVYRVNGRQRKESARTLDEARRLKRARESDRDRGEFQAESRMGFREYADEWIGRYQGNGRQGFTDETRIDYRRDLDRYAYPFLDERLGRTVSAVSRRDLARWVAWLCDEREQGERAERLRRERAAERKGVPVASIESRTPEPLRLADATVRRIVSPVRACLSTAADEGLIRSNPADGLRLPNRPRIEEGDEEAEARALTREQLRTFLAIVHPEWRTLFRLLASTGLRWGEVAALRWGDLRLDGSEPCVRVRRALGRTRRAGQPPAFKPPKSRHGRRDVPLDASLVSELRSRRDDADDDALVFPAGNGAPLRQENVRRRVLKPAAEEAGVSWIGFHTFRHTCASLLFARGKNAKQVQRWLGHHAASFTLDTYAHLLDDGVGEALDLGAELATTLADDDLGSVADERGGNPAGDRYPAVDRVA